MKNEIQIITLPSELWASWKTFLNKHSEGELIDPDTDKMFKEDRKFKLKQQTLKREFFKHCGHFTDRDFGVLAQHLIGATPGRTILYPKVSVACTRYLAPSNHAHADWVERRKRKKVILQDFMALNPDLHFTDEGGGHNRRCLEAVEAEASVHDSVMGLPTVGSEGRLLPTTTSE